MFKEILNKQENEDLKDDESFRSSINGFDSQRRFISNISENRYKR